MKKFLLLGFLCVLIFGFGAVGSLNALPFVGSLDNLSNYGAADLQPIIDDWNTDNQGDLLDIVDPPGEPDFNPPPEYEVDEEQLIFTITWTGDWDYLSAKYSTNVDLFYIAGLSSIEWAGEDLGGNDKNKLSHWRLWNPTPVPEPATMLLLGSGLVGLFGFRKKFRKK